MACLKKLAAPNWLPISLAASPSNSSGISRPSLNRTGKSTSKRRDLLLIGCLPPDGEDDVLVGQSGEGGFGHDMFAGFEYLAGKSPKEETEGSFLRVFFRKSDDHHAPTSPEN